MRVRSILWSISFVMTLAVGLAPAQAETTSWDAATEFNWGPAWGGSNTADHTWQYLKPVVQAPDDNVSGYTLLPTFNATGGSVDGNAIYAWDDSGAVPWVGVSGSGFSRLFAAPRYLDSVIGWKNPGIAGTFDATFSLTVVDNPIVGDGIEYRLYREGDVAPLISGTLAASSTTGTITVPSIAVLAGKMLYLRVNCGPAWDTGGDMTEVSFGIHSVPEPATLALLGCAAVSLLAYAWRKRK